MGILAGDCFVFISFLRNLIPRICAQAENKKVILLS